MRATWLVALLRTTTALVKHGRRVLLGDARLVALAVVLALPCRGEAGGVKTGDFLVITKAVARSTVGSPPNQMELKKVLTFSDWKINGRALASDEAAATEDRTDGSAPPSGG